MENSATSREVASPQKVYIQLVNLGSCACCGFWGSIEDEVKSGSHLLAVALCGLSKGVLAAPPRLPRRWVQAFSAW